MDRSAEVILLFLCVRPQGQGVAVEEEQLLVTGSPPREWGKNMCLVKSLASLVNLKPDVG